MDIKNVYENIAKSFNITRYKKWICVDLFLQNIQKDENIIELGCGNGKNIIDHKEQSFGIDICENFVNICIEKGINAVQGNILNYNYGNIKYDFVLCIAVIHHFKNINDKLEVIKIIYNLLKPGAKALLTAWNITEDKYKFNLGDNYLKFGKEMRYYYIFDINELKNLCLTYFDENKIKYTIECGNDILILEK